MKKNLKTIFYLLIVLLVLVGFYYFFILEEDEVVVPGEEIITMQIANPASVYCEENGGEIEIRTAEDGSQTGFCLFEDGSECEEWAFFRGDCNTESNN